MIVHILALGDVCGQSGLDFVTRSLRRLKAERHIEFTVVNGENAAVKGILPRQAEALFDAGADVITLGNHTFGKNGIQDYLEECPYILRPANLAPQNPGHGWGIFDTGFGPVCVANAIGRCDMPFGPDNPFFQMDKILEREKPKFTLVDFHAEATSEKLAMAYYLDGRVSALWGTHTHVQTSDAQVLARGTGYITDLGMSGPERSVLGIRPEQSISLFLNNPPQRFESAPGPCKIEGAVFALDTQTGHCTGVEPIRLTERK